MRQPEARRDLILDENLEFFLYRAARFPGHDLKTFAQGQTDLDAAHDNIDRIGEIGSEPIEITASPEVHVPMGQEQPDRDPESSRLAMHQGR